MKFIFLDFDGVINNCGNDDDYIFYPVKDKKGKIHNLPFSASNIKSLKELFDFAYKSNIKFILSTSWREVIHYSEINEMFKNFFGLTYLREDIIIGETPIIYSDDYIRGREIKKYLENFDNLEEYLIIDDNFDFLPEQIDKLILVKAEKGFTEKDLKKVKRHFCFS